MICNSIYLDDDCILAILKYIPQKSLPILSTISKRFNLLIQNACLWNNVVISRDKYGNAVDYILKIIIPKQIWLQSLCLIDLLDESRLLATLDSLFIKFGPRLKSFTLIEQNSTLFNNVITSENKNL